MTTITFLGTGEAFDPNRSTTSYLIENNIAQTLMVDCGYDSPKSLMRYLKKHGKSVADVPNSLLFTHEHGDHFGGLPALLMPIWEEVNGIVGKRKDSLQRKIEIASAHEYLLLRVEQAMETDYKGFFERFKKEGPDISLRALKAEGDVIRGFRIRAALTSHGAPNFAYRFDDIDGKSFAISGDGAFTDASRELFSGTNLLIHEGFNVLGSGGKNHASIEQVVDYAVTTSIPRAYIVHVNREEREKLDDIEKMRQKAD